MDPKARGLDHSSKTKSETPVDPSKSVWRRNDETMTCHRCKKVGHRAKNCTATLPVKLNVLSYKTNHQSSGCLDAHLPDGTAVKILIDTGAQGYSFCNKRIRDVIAAKHPHQVQNTDQLIVLGDGRTTFLCTEKIETELLLQVQHLGIRNRSIKLEMLVLPEHSNDVLIGWNDMLKLNLIPELVQIAQRARRDSSATVTPLVDEKRIAQMGAMLDQYPDVFRRELTPQPALLEPFRIVLKDGGVLPRTDKVRNRTPLMRETIEREIEQLLAQGLIEPSTTDRCSQVHLVKKSNRTWRFCIDYRDLNALTISDAYPLPRIDAIVPRLANHRWYSIIDLRKGYFQLRLAEESKSISAFITHHGTYQWCRIPMGAKNATAFFQRQMKTKVLKDAEGFTEVYVDDIIIFSKTEADHWKHIEWVLKRLREYRIIANLEKCRWFQPEIQYLGIRINEQGHFMSEERKSALKRMTPPSTMTQLRSFLGTANYFRDYIQDFAHLTKPLMKKVTPIKGARVQLDDTEQAHFHKIKDAIVNSSMLYFIQPEGLLRLYTDASNVACGAHLVQVIEGKERTLCFTSHIFAKSQEHWSICDKEMFGAVAAVRRLHHFLADRFFELVTDHRNLSFKTNKSPRVQRWKEELQGYDFAIRVIPGEQNHVADTLSRLVPGGDIDADDDKEVTLREFLQGSVGDDLADEDEPEHRSIEINNITSGPQDNFSSNEDSPATISTNPTADGGKDWDQEIAKFHNDATLHPSANVILQRMTEAKYSWPNMIPMIRKFVNSCPTCQRIRDKRTQYHGEKYSTMTESVLDMVAADTLGPMAEDASGYKYILVMIDMFSRFIELVPLRTVTAKETSMALKAFFCRYGMPRQLRTDSGTQFKNELITSLLQANNIAQVVTTPGNHAENGMVENRMRLLRRYLGPHPRDSYQDFCAQAQYDINSRVHATTGLAPADLMFGDAKRFVPRSTAEDLTTDDRLLEAALRMRQEQKARHQRAITRQNNPAKGHTTVHTATKDSGQRMKTGIEESVARDRKNKRQREQENGGQIGHIVDEDSTQDDDLPITTDRVTRRSKTPRQTPLTDGDWVWVEAEQAVKTGRIRRYGPFRIVHVKNSIVTYESPIYPGRERSIHVSRCHRYIVRDGTQPHEEALKYDDTYFVVEAILNHRIKGKRASVNSIEVEVKWSGYDETTWEPLKGTTIRRLTLVHEYIANKPELQHLKL